MTFDWSHGLVGVISAFTALGITAVRSLFRGILWGAQVKPNMKLDLQQHKLEHHQDMATLENDLRDAIAAVEKRLANMLDEQTKFFDDTFKAIRQRITDVETGGLREFARKPDFDLFRSESRDDMSNFRKEMMSQIQNSTQNIIAMIRQNGHK
jgi:hypothetical protein